MCVESAPEALASLLGYRRIALRPVALQPVNLSELIVSSRYGTLAQGVCISDMQSQSRGLCCGRETVLGLRVLRTKSDRGMHLARGITPDQLLESTYF